MKFLLRRLGYLLIVWILLFIGTGMWTSGALLQPPRRQIQDYHREILSQPELRGLQIERYTAPQQTPALLAMPSTRQPGMQCKALIARDTLAKRDCVLRPWGDVRGTIVLLHGYRGRKEDFLPAAERFCAAGFRCILIDLPGHGDHPQTLATFGNREVSLVEAVLSDAQRRFHCADEPAFLFGLSQGGAIALQTAAHAPEKWSGVASIAAFSNLVQPIACKATSLWPSASWTAPITEHACSCGVKWRAGFYPSEVSPLAAATRLTLPVFIAHGENDDFIPASAARKLFAAVPHSRKSLRIIPNANHHNVLSTGSHALYADVCEFLLKANEPSAQKPAYLSRNH